MALQGQNIFYKVKSDEEKRAIFSNLVVENKEIIAKSVDAGEAIFVLTAMKGNRDQVYCKVESPSDEMNNLTKLILQFTSGTEKYFTQVNCNFINNMIVFDTDADVFQLHRREDFRLKLPGTYKGFFQIDKLNSEEKIEKFSLVDISAGGCRLEVSLKKLKLKIGDVLDGEVQLAKWGNTSVTGLIKHVAPHPSNTNLQMVGVEFINLSSSSKNRLVGVVMDVYRELFARL